jgi:hypothetical protein
MLAGPAAARPPARGGNASSEYPLRGSLLTITQSHFLEMTQRRANGVHAPNNLYASVRQDSHNPTFLKLRIFATFHN